MAEQDIHTPLSEAVKAETMGAVNNPDFVKGPMYKAHLTEVERWANIICDIYPEADREVVLMGVWTHDVGAFGGRHDIHEVLSEQYVLATLPKLGVSDDKVVAVAHCARTHRCKADAMPQTLEAKILATADSASHLTDPVYIDMLKRLGTDPTISMKYIQGKIDRDLRDVTQFSLLSPDLQQQMVGLAKGWKLIINNWPNLQ